MRLKDDTIKTVLIIALILTLIGVICASCTKQNPDPCGCQAIYKQTGNEKQFEACQLNCK